MKILLSLAMVLLFTALNAEELTFEALRQEQRALVLREFKELYKERQDIHQNLRQVLKHVRAKNLGRNQLSFFQPLKESHDMETSNVFFSAVLPDDETPDIDTGGESVSGGDYSGGAEPPIETPVDSVKDENIRPTVVSPWALR